MTNGRPMARRLAAVLSAVFISVAPVFAHSWYDSECCSGKDCQPIPCEDLTEKGKTVVWNKLVFYDAMIKPSKDKDCHICVMYLGTGSERPLCVYIQTGM